MEANDSEGAATAERQVGKKQVPHWGCGRRRAHGAFLPCRPTALPGSCRVLLASLRQRPCPVGAALQLWETKDRRGGHTQHTPSLRVHKLTAKARDSANRLPPAQEGVGQCPLRAGVTAALGVTAPQPRQGGGRSPSHPSGPRRAGGGRSGGGAAPGSFRSPRGNGSRAPVLPQERAVGKEEPNPQPPLPLPAERPPRDPRLESPHRQDPAPRLRARAPLPAPGAPPQPH